MKNLFKIIAWAVLFSLGALGDIVAQVAPSNLVAATKSSSRIDLTWKDNDGNETGFDVQWGISTSYGDGSAPINTKNVEAHSVTGLKANTKYYFRVRAKTATTVSAWVTAEATTLANAPLQPTNLNASAASESQINFSWQKKSNDETGFDWECHSNAGFTALVKSGSVDGNTVTVAVTGLSAGTPYYLRVRAKNGGGISDWTSTSTKTNDALPKPAVPGNPGANAVSSTQIDFRWETGSGNTAGETASFDWQCSTDRTFGTVTKSGNTTAKTVSVTGLNPTTLYFFRVQAKNRSGDSGWTSPIEKSTQNIPPPLQPTNLSASAASESQINFSWQKKSNDETGFDWECHSNAGFTALVKSGSVDGNTLTVAVTGLNAGTTYYLRVMAKNSGGISQWTTISAKTNDALPKPSAPTSLLASAVSSSQINLSWTDNSGNETGFDLERSSDGSTFNALASVDANTTTYQNTGLTANTKYYYRVRSKNSAGSSGWSNVVEATTQAPPVTVPSTPTGLLASAVSSSQINLSWTDNSGNETGFDLERSSDGSTFNALASVDANATTYQNTGLTANTKYYYRVRAKNSAGSSGWSNVAEATTQAPPVTVPSTPASLLASAVSSSQINLSWTDNSGNETGFDLERSSDGSTFNALASVDANATTYQNTGLTANTKYYYRVRAKNSAGSSGWSNVAEATTQAPPVLPLATPTRLRQKSGNPAIHELSLEWDDNADNETAYELSRSTNTEANWEIIQANLPANTKEYLDKSVRSGFKYYYRVRTVKTGAFSEYSNVLALSAPLVTSVSIAYTDDIPVYPNPFSSHLYLKTTRGKVSTVEVLNSLGVVLKVWTNPASNSLEVADLPTGIYFLRINQLLQSTTIKIIKQY